jgi:hypothetical protein
VGGDQLRDLARHERNPDTFHIGIDPLDVVPQPDVVPRRLVVPLLLKIV